ncbi:hypothetical protein GTP23_13125 [Pseudoduganella sp. FT93W]|uniref:Uncharacterized protein n=1 Tax=Duganella fentianensis TaxID=2692177 RepID=A0A845I2P8_9BURK|nr:hypothetical protein [Duganella fentianensis]MYN45991.1 hypothetical protein [Duganella fentianensis]
MFIADFLFSFPEVLLQQSVRLEVEALAVGNAGRMRVTYRVGDKDNSLSPVCVAWLEGYKPWSESPEALLLRAMHVLQVEQASKMPCALLKGSVQQIKLSVAGFDARGETGVELVSLDLIRRDQWNRFVLRQYTPTLSATRFDLDFFNGNALAAAFKAVRAIQPVNIDMRTMPATQPVDVVIDTSGIRYVLREQIPSYALEAFDAFSRRFRLASCGSIKSKALVHARDWEQFVAA